MIKENPNNPACPVAPADGTGVNPACPVGSLLSYWGALACPVGSENRTGAVYPVESSLPIQPGPEGYLTGVQSKINAKYTKL